MVSIAENDCWSDRWQDVHVGSCLDTDPLFSSGKLSWRSLRQVHGNQVFDDDSFYGPSQEGDGLVTDAYNTALLIRTADCVPVHVTDGRRIGILHAGWRGTAAGIVKGLEKFFNDMNRVRVWIGPSIHGRNYEVDSDLYLDWVEREPQLADFLQEHKPGATKRLLDLRGFIRQQLLDMGVPVTAVIPIPVCTYDSTLPSYRRQGLEARRIINYIWREPIR